MAYNSKRSEKPKTVYAKKNSEEFLDFFFALPSSFLLAETFWNSDQDTTQIGSTMMESKSRKMTECMAVMIAESVVAVVMAGAVLAVVAVVIAKSVVAAVMAVTRTRNSK
jgi:hypothetical protein